MAGGWDARGHLDAEAIEKIPVKRNRKNTKRSQNPRRLWYAKDTGNAEGIFLPHAAHLCTLLHDVWTGTSTSRGAARRRKYRHCTSCSNPPVEQYRNRRRFGPQLRTSRRGSETRRYSRRVLRSGHDASPMPAANCPCTTPARGTL